MCTKYIEYDNLEQTLKDTCEKLKLSNAVTSALIDEVNRIPILEESKVPGEYLLSGSTMNIYIKGYGAGRRDFERPKGKWVPSGDTYYCSICGKYCYNLQKFRYCQDCGASMEET